MRMDVKTERPNYGRPGRPASWSYTPRLFPQPQPYRRSHPSFTSSTTDLNLPTISESRTKYDFRAVNHSTDFRTNGTPFRLDPSKKDIVLASNEWQRPLILPQRLHDTRKYTPSRARYPPRAPGTGFRELPEQILLLILAHLRNIHLEPGSLSCFTCYSRNMVAVALSCRKWWKAVQIGLYEDIQLNGSESAIHVKNSKVKYSARLILLRRTLQNRQDIAANVKSFKPPAISDTSTSHDLEKYLDLIASLVQICPNLQKLVGFYPNYKHTLNRFYNTLSTRTQLIEHVWVIEPSPFKRQARYKLSEDKSTLLPIPSPARLRPEECMAFLKLHSNWSNLKSLILHCNPGGTIDSVLFSEVFSLLPSLENLHVSDLPGESFDDLALLSLPPLKTLRLSNLLGISARGLSNFATLTSTNGLTSLSLISIPLLSLPVLARLLSQLKSLTSFTIAQEPAPTLPIGTTIFLYPYLASQTLTFLHWEFTHSEDDTADRILAKSIASNGFPALRTLRSPNDPEGLHQQLCKPQERAELPGDKYRNMDLQSRLTSLPRSPSASSIRSGSTRSQTWSVFSHKPTRSSDESVRSQVPEKGMNLVTARRNAQRRINDAQPSIPIRIWDDSGMLVDNRGWGNFIGDVCSQIKYFLKPDLEGMDTSLVGIENLLDDSKEIYVKDGCTGLWNIGSDDVGKRKGRGGAKDKGAWWHAERVRWSEIPLEKLF